MHLSQAQFQIALTAAAEPLNIGYWAGWDDAHDGWCVYLVYENILANTRIAGPFKTQEEAELVLGCDIKWTQH